MQTYWNTAFSKRDYECTNVVAIKADRLPSGFDPKTWKRNGDDVQPTAGGLMHLGTTYANGERYETWGYL